MNTSRSVIYQPVAARHSGREETNGGVPLMHDGLVLAVFYSSIIGTFFGARLGFVALLISSALILTGSK
jgi:hypothetical protein